MEDEEVGFEDRAPCMAAQALRIAHLPQRPTPFLISNNRDRRPAHSGIRAISALPKFDRAEIKSSENGMRNKRVEI